MATNTYVALSTQTLSSAVSSVTFSSISQAYTDLVMVYAPLGSTNSVTHSMRINSDTASNYSLTGMRGDGSSASSYRASNQTSLVMYPNDYDNTTIPSVITVNFQNYSNTTTYKTILWRAGMSAGGQGVSTQVGLWRKTPEAITSITLTSTGNFAAGSTFTLYGIAADTGAYTAKATGGTITADQFNVIHTFTSSGTFTPTEGLVVDYLVIGGGGGGGGTSAYFGGATYGAGGGAGGYRTSIGGTPLSLTAQNYTITVGAGGTGGASNSSTAGSVSIFSTIQSSGGGRGSSTYPAAGSDAGGTGGSGGGARQTAGTGNSGGYTPVEGYSGYGYGASGTSTGGGGGASAAATSSVGANGASSSINGTATTRAGGGGGFISGAASTGGSGGGGAAVLNGTGTAGTTNTGSGGGAAGSSTSASRSGGAGGSGIVIVRYAK